jgi:DNA-binding NarL/FixJ family response regulator
MKIVLVEDQAIVRDAIRTECVRDFGHEVVGEADSGTGAVDLIVRLRPDAVILDLGLPGMDGFAVAALVRHALPQVRILVLSGLIDDHAIFRIEKAGVHGFVDKNASTLASLKEALAALADGKTWFSPAYQAARAARQKNPRSIEKLLSETERHILSLIGQGLTDEEIGQRLAISSTTAQTHRSNILQKLNVNGTAKLVAYAIRHGFARA